MRINIILPPPSMKIAGGYKIVYQYANYLCKKGENVNIIYSCNKGSNKYNIPRRLFYLLKVIVSRIEPRWFKLNKKVNKITMYEVDSDIIDADIIIATACATSTLINKMKVCKGKKIYLIQGFENWGRSDEEVYITYRYDMKKIVVSKWLKKIVDSHSEEDAIYIPNGIDGKKFNINNNIDNRNQYSLAMLYHNEKAKRSKEGIQIIENLKRKYPELKVEMFGSPKKPNNLPSYINYTRNANEEQLNKIYNKSAIFVCTSLVEGYGLTGIESMCCGCALVSTACKGVQEYAIDRYNSLLSSVENLQLLEKNLELLLNDNDERIRIASNASTIHNDFSLSKSEESFYNVIING